MNVINMMIEDLIPYENNPRVNDEAVKYVANSIKEFGFKVPIIVDKNNVIVAGHTRYKACKELGIKNVPVIIADDLSEEQIKAFRLADNKVSEKAEWNFDLLDDELNDLLNFDINMEDFGFDLDLRIDEEQEIIEDEVPDVPEEPKAKLGDIYQLGNHRLMCGDSTSEENVAKLMNGVKADMIFTDPPYGIDVVGETGNIGGDTQYGKAGKYKKVIGDNTEYDPSFILKKFKDSKLLLWGANYYANKLFNSGKWLVWDKNRGEGTTFSDCELCWTNLDGIAVKKYKCTWDGMRREGESGTRVHPTQKPIKLCADIINDYSNENDNILDLFGGSGSTLIACEQLNRKCYMMELDPRYVDVIIERWENFTGEKAVKIEGE